VTPKLAPERALKPSGFSTTRWSLIATGASLDPDEEEARHALAELCRTYWRPIFSFVCSRGYSPEDAQDLTQDFFAMILRSNLLGQADRRRGRFRSLLVKTLDNFLNDSVDWKNASKRGGKMKAVSWDEWMEEAASALSISAQAVRSLPSDQLFDLRWAATVAEQALGRLSEECEAHGRIRLFDVLSGFLTTERNEISYAQIGATLGVGEAVVKHQLHNLRRRYRLLLREEVARTVGSSAEIDDEIRYLCAALGAVGN
jgi:RNA polymerase sigma-70 factor (ECF subfamily)